MNDTIPPEYAKLHEDYLAKLSHLKYRVMFVCLDNGHHITQLSKPASIWWMRALLTSGHDESVRCAVEAMSRTLEVW
jgi:hypothetical protein